MMMVYQIGPNLFSRKGYYCAEVLGFTMELQFWDCYWNRLNKQRNKYNDTQRWHGPEMSQVSRRFGENAKPRNGPCTVYRCMPEIMAVYSLQIQISMYIIYICIQIYLHTYTDTELYRIIYGRCDIRHINISVYMPFKNIATALYSVY